jgi:hypothetical protein
VALDLLTVQEHRVKAGVQGKMFLIYGGPKTGKTTTACQFSKPLLLAFEPGYNLIDGVKAVSVTSWVDMKNYAKQLKKPEVRAMYDTLIIDTAPLMWGLAEKFVKTQKDIEDLTDLGFGKGYRAVRDEFQDVINSLGQMGYTLVFISHAEKKDYVDALGVSHSGITPAMDKRPREIISGLVDVYMFVCQESDGNGGNRPVAFFRGGTYGDIEIEAGSRYGDGLPVKINFNYDELVKAVQSADEAMLSAGIKISTENKTILEEAKETATDTKKKSFSEVYKEVTSTINKLKERIVAGEADLADTMTGIIEQYLGAGKKITEATPAQQDLVEAALAELKEL